LLVGKEVTFRVDYSVPTTGREFGALYLNNENVALTLVREGWADVREVRASEAENADVEALFSFKAEAQAAKRGIWQEESVSTLLWIDQLRMVSRSFASKQLQLVASNRMSV